MLNEVVNCVNCMNKCVHYTSRVQTRFFWLENIECKESNVCLLLYFIASSTLVSCNLIGQVLGKKNVTKINNLLT